MQRKWVVLMGLLIVLLIAVGSTVLAAGETLPRAALVAGGGRVSNDAYTLTAAMGQPVAGVVRGVNQSLCAGIQCPGSLAPVNPTPPLDEQLYVPSLVFE